MLADVVIDSNIFGHAQNPGLGAWFAEATTFLTELLEVETHVCLDEGVGSGQGRILAEYEKVISPTGLAAPVLAQVLLEGRYREVPGRVPSIVRTRVNGLVRAQKAMDRLFLCVTYQSHESVFVTHDDQDFGDEVREQALDQLGIRIVDAVDCCPLLN